MKLWQNSRKWQRLEIICRWTQTQLVCRAQLLNWKWEAVVRFSAQSTTEDIICHVMRQMYRDWMEPKLKGCCKYSWRRYNLPNRIEPSRLSWQKTWASTPRLGAASPCAGLSPPRSRSGWCTLPPEQSSIVNMKQFKEFHCKYEIIFMKTKGPTLIVKLSQQ